MKAAGITPDIVIHTDPQNLKAVFREENGELVSCMITGSTDELEGVSYFVTSSSGSPENFDIPVKEGPLDVSWYESGAFLH